VRDFWQNFPKQQWLPDGTIEVDLFPNGEVFRHNLRVGEEKTHTCGFVSHRGTDTFGFEQWAKAITPAGAQASPAWITETKALGEVPVSDTAKWPVYEHYARVAFEPTRTSIRPWTIRIRERHAAQAIENYNMFGWQDYGDVPLDTRPLAPSGWAN